MTAVIIRADARYLPLPDDSVDLIMTSPPYWGQRSYVDGGRHYTGQLGDEATPNGFIDNLTSATAEWVRVLKRTGSLWVNLGDKYAGTNGRVPNGTRSKSLIGLPYRYAIACMDRLGLYLRAEVVWQKTSGLPEAVDDRVRRSHEHWFHFTLAPQYFANVDPLRIPSDFKGVSYRERLALGEAPRPTRGLATGTNGAIGGLATHPMGALPGSVWECPVENLVVPPHIAHIRCCGGEPVAGCDKGVDHYAAFPLFWPRRIISAWCPPGGVVLDPFGGTGTVALVADVMDRTGISVDLSWDYGDLIARWRLSDPGERARAMQVPKPPKQQVAHEDIFDILGAT